jgi:hypothetical protein
MQNPADDREELAQGLAGGVETALAKTALAKTALAKTARAVTIQSLNHTLHAALGWPRFA